MTIAFALTIAFLPGLWHNGEKKLERMDGHGKRKQMERCAGTHPAGCVRSRQHSLLELERRAGGEASAKADGGYEAPWHAGLFHARPGRSGNGV